MKMLTVIPTPIGNIADISQRSIDALGSVDTLLCESISNTKKLYQILGIPMPKLVRFWQKTESHVISNLDQLDGEHIGLITDAGMPCISDPGYTLVDAWVKQGYKMTVLPGPSALTTAIALSGIPAERFQFLGFLAPKSSACQEQLVQARDSGMASLIYESPHRVLRLCEDIQVTFGEDHQVCVMRELTKAFEEVFRGSIASVIKQLEDSTIKGEYCVVIARKPPLDKWQQDALVLSDCLGIPQASLAVSKIHHVSKSKVYSYLLAK